MARRGGFVNSFAGVELSPGLEEAMSPAGFRNLLTYAAATAGNNWISKWLPKRWDPQYAKTMLGADGGKDGIPFFSRGRLIASAYKARARVRSRGTDLLKGSGGVELRITIPGGFLSLHPRQSRAFRSLPVGERMDINDWFEEAVSSAITQSLSGKASRLKRGVGRRTGLARSLMPVVRAARSSKMLSSNLALRTRLMSARAHIISSKWAHLPRSGGGVHESAQRLPIFRQSYDGRVLAMEKWRKASISLPSWIVNRLRGA